MNIPLFDSSHKRTRSSVVGVRIYLTDLKHFKWQSYVQCICKLPHAPKKIFQWLNHVLIGHIAVKVLLGGLVTGTWNKLGSRMDNQNVVYVTRSGSLYWTSAQICSHLTRTDHRLIASDCYFINRFLEQWKRKFWPIPTVNGHITCELCGSLRCRSVFRQYLWSQWTNMYLLQFRG